MKTITIETSIGPYNKPILEISPKSSRVDNLVFEHCVAGVYEKSRVIYDNASNRLTLTTLLEMHNYRIIFETPLADIKSKKRLKPNRV